MCPQFDSKADNFFEESLMAHPSACSERFFSQLVSLHFFPFKQSRTDEIDVISTDYFKPRPCYNSVVKVSNLLCSTGNSKVRLELEGKSCSLCH